MTKSTQTSSISWPVPTSGRETAYERIYFNAVGLAYVDVAIAYAMYRRAREAGVGTRLAIQDNLIFQHDGLANWMRM